MSSIPTFNARNKVRDPLHGYIELTDDEMLIINHKVFQRLRNIKQLGTTYLVYPGATHGRFTHSLGVLYLSTKIFDIIMGKNSSIITWDYNEIKKQRQMLRIASLLHDIGHSPFSHVGDNLFSPVIKNHEEMSANLIINTDLSEIIDMIGRKNGGFTYREIAGLIKGRIPSNYLLIKRVFSGDIIDADRMDYLLRDSLMLGVKYGKYDLDHLINSLNIIIDNNIPILSIEEKGIYALEEFILARHFMFTQVYLHKTRRIYDKILERSMQCMLPSNHLPIREEEFLQWDDNRVLEYIKNNPNSYNDMFLNRGHLKLVFERFPYIKEEEKLIISEIEELINNRRYLDTEVIVDRYTQNAIKFEDEMGNPSIGILDKNKNIHHVDKYSSILSKINDSLDVFRIYANEEKRDEIIKVIEEAYSKCLRP
ncbi:hypothetical protein BJL90_01290 [Clostridium formicaceticum]|nr:hypothetical protein BJL90_01290 [Clostridium formicaceticum]